jgi:hypothetical protein
LYKKKVYDLLSKTKNDEVDLKDPKFGKRLEDSNKTVVKTMENAFKFLSIGFSREIDVT